MDQRPKSDEVPAVVPGPSTFWMANGARYVSVEPPDGRRGRDRAVQASQVAFAQPVREPEIQRSPAIHDGGDTHVPVSNRQGKVRDQIRLVHDPNAVRQECVEGVAEVPVSSSRAGEWEYVSRERDLFIQRAQRRSHSSLSARRLNSSGTERTPRAADP